MFKKHLAVVVAVAGNYTSDSTPRLGTSMCRGCGSKKKKPILSSRTPSCSSSCCLTFLTTSFLLWFSQPPSRTSHLATWFCLHAQVHLKFMFTASTSLSSLQFCVCGPRRRRPQCHLLCRVAHSLPLLSGSCHCLRFLL